MMMDLLKAIFIVGIPVALISYALAYYTLKKTGLELNKLEELEKSKNLKTAKKQISSKSQDNLGFWEKLFLKEWMKFGGGFYGMVTFLTYIHIEFIEIIDFVQALDQISLSIGSIINFFVNSIVNFVRAFAWPFYWSKILPMQSLWIWVGVALVSHIVATKRAYWVFKQREKA